MRETTGELGARIGGQMYLAHRYARAATNEALREFGIELRHLGVLNMLAQNGPMNQRTLVDRLQMDKSSMVYVIDELERQGLAERRRDPRDRRSYQVSITGEGRDRVAAATTATELVMDRLCEPLSGPERRRLSELLARFIAHAQG
ncbi:MarR family winged helix-turn-helix transcriptional regulator [Nocardia nova]|uniref:MarR family winged helix-turn-helix transcriptional regulator n=1 Tax=Nocardia nova TaxID=37330 RepID=UPI0033EBFA4C